MKWVVLSILGFVVAYTLVNLRYRKPGRAFEPHEDLKNRATTARLLAAGWQRIPVTARRPADITAVPAAGTGAIVARGGAGLPAELAAAFVEAPRLTAGFGRVAAPREIARGADYSATFQCGFADLKAQLGDISLYRKGSVVVLIPSIEPVPGQLLSRAQDGFYCLSFPTQSLPPGRYTALLVARGPAAKWEFFVK